MSKQLVFAHFRGSREKGETRRERIGGLWAGLFLSLGSEREEGEGRGGDCTGGYRSIGRREEEEERCVDGVTRSHRQNTGKSAGTGKDRGREKGIAQAAIREANCAVGDCIWNQKDLEDE